MNTELGSKEAVQADLLKLPSQGTIATEKGFLNCLVCVSSEGLLTDRHLPSITDVKLIGQSSCWLIEPKVGNKYSALRISDNKELQPPKQNGDTEVKST